MPHKNRKKRRTRKDKYRSNFEREGAKALPRSARYEDEVLEYEVPARKAEYTPDFTLNNGIILEFKGKLDAATRKKMVLVRDQNPDRDIRLVFMRPNNKIRRGSPTTYAMWAEKNGFEWCKGPEVPKEWLKHSR